MGPEVRAARGAAGSMRQLTLPIAPGPAPRFENFRIGANAAALPALQALLNLPRPSTPVMLWGPAGSGKSHLLHAVEAALAETGHRAGRLEAGGPLPAGWDERWALLILDGAEALDPLRQHVAFTLFVEASTRGLPVLSAARLPPVDLPLREDLRSRLGWGLVFQLQPLDEAGVREVLRDEAVRRGLKLQDEAIDWLLLRQARDLGTLMGLLDRVDAYALEHQRAVTIPLLRAMLGGWAEHPAEPA